MKKKTPHPLPVCQPQNSLVDTHCHLDMDAYSEDPDEVIRSAKKAGVRRIITVGIDLASSNAAVSLARRHTNVWATVGLHPHNAADAGKDVFEQFTRIASDPASKVVGYGEIGLDFAKNYAPREVQLKAFSDQLDLAKQLGLPIIIHDRDAHAETIAELKRFAPYPAGGVMHCFSGDMELARQVMELDFYISIPGIVTFNKSEILQQVAREIPLEKMLLETDGPFLAPVPFRGRTNRPEYLLYTAQKIAELRNIPLDDVADRTTRNAEQLFGLKPARATL